MRYTRKTWQITEESRKQVAGWRQVVVHLMASRGEKGGLVLFVDKSVEGMGGDSG